MATGRDIRGSLSLDITSFKTNLLSAKTMFAEFQATVNSFNVGIGGIGGTTTPGEKNNLTDADKQIDNFIEQVNKNTTANENYERELARLSKQQSKNNKTLFF
jgi:hypothetical protein